MSCVRNQKLQGTAHDKRCQRWIYVMCAWIIPYTFASTPTIHILFNIRLAPLMRNTMTLTSQQTRKHDCAVTALQTFPPPSLAVISRENWALVSLSSFWRVERVPLKAKGRNVHRQLITKITSSLVGILREHKSSCPVLVPSVVRELRRVTFEPLKKSALLK